MRSFIDKCQMIATYYCCIIAGKLQSSSMNWTSLRRFEKGGEAINPVIAKSIKF